MRDFLSLEGIFHITIYIILAFLLIWIISIFKFKNQDENKRYFLLGFSFKIFCCLAFALIYDFYYNWLGDTIYYYNSSQSLALTFFKAPDVYFKFLFGTITPENFNTVASETYYYPPFSDTSRYAIHRFLSPFAIISGKNYYTENICLAVFLFLINWRFFSFLCKRIKCSKKIIFIATMFIPSSMFWSSGLMKDSFTFSFCFVFIMCFCKLFLERKLNIFAIIGLFLSSYIIMQLKVYILYSAIGACLVWLTVSYIKKVKSTFIKFFITPLIVVIAIGGGIYALRYISTEVGGVYGNVDDMLNKASAAQIDLKQDYYDGESFDIGDFDGSIGSLVSLGPKAIIAGLYRPFIFECRSAIMFLSGTENTILLLLTIWVFFKTGIKFTFKQVFTNPFVLMCLSFSVVFALGIGISTSNFGALIRFKIPLIPLYLLGIMEIYYAKKTITSEANTNNEDIKKV